VAFPYRLLSFYPPFIGAGIRVRVDEADPYTIAVRMPLRWFNKNVFGTHFGGSLYAMADPFFVLILQKTLGPGYTVWDKAACITFVRPGRGTVQASFHVPRAEVEAIRARADAGEVIEPTYEVDVLDDAGQVVTHVQKVLHVRKRK
jgi:acyl-coenzyme A thioesterase PaaI-like protein